MAVLEGCVRIVNLLAAAGLTTTLPEVAALSAPLLKSIVMVSALLYAKFPKVAKPFTAVALVVPCNDAVPALREALTTVLLSLVRRLPKASSIRICGEGEKATPAVAVLDGWIEIVSRVAAAELTVILEDVALAKLPLLN